MRVKVENNEGTGSEERATLNTSEAALIIAASFVLREAISWIEWNEEKRSGQGGDKRMVGLGIVAVIALLFGLLWLFNHGGQDIERNSDHRRRCGFR